MGPQTVMLRKFDIVAISFLRLCWVLSRPSPGTRTAQGAYPAFHCGYWPKSWVTASLLRGVEGKPGDKLAALFLRGLGSSGPSTLSNSPPTGPVPVTQLLGHRESLSEDSSVTATHPSVSLLICVHHLCLASSVQ